MGPDARDRRDPRRPVDRDGHETCNYPGVAGKRPKISETPDAPMTDERAHVTAHMIAARDHMAPVQARRAAAHAEVSAGQAERAQGPAGGAVAPSKGGKP